LKNKGKTLQQHYPLLRHFHFSACFGHAQKSICLRFENDFDCVINQAVDEPVEHVIRINELFHGLRNDGRQRINDGLARRNNGLVESGHDDVLEDLEVVNNGGRFGVFLVSLHDALEVERIVALRFDGLLHLNFVGVHSIVQNLSEFVLSVVNRAPRVNVLENHMERPKRFVHLVEVLRGFSGLPPGPSRPLIHLFEGAIEIVGLHFTELFQEQFPTFFVAFHDRRFDDLEDLCQVRGHVLFQKWLDNAHAAIPHFVDDLFFFACQEARPR